ncbi:MAG: LPXTG cell wall anchor domain-containing protein [Clostridia bacterium]|nr:LPXTG cell wall anchor domain-containing protein [Clostridia bacterium]
MKNKLLSLLLVITLLAITVSVGLPSTLAADSDNLLTNGDFSDYSGYTPTSWLVSPNSNGGASAQIVEDTELPNGTKVNALKVSTTIANTKLNRVTHAKKIKIEKNASYTMTYWVKVKAIKGLKTSMYEPDYIDKNGNPGHNDNPADGTNIYSYRYDDGSTRVIRTDIEHSWTVAETGTVIDANGPSMFISRSGGVAQVLTPDYPKTNREGEWLQVVHTFATDNLAAHEADVTYQVNFPSAVGGEVWLADFKMSVVKSEVEDYYTPAINDAKLGCVSKEVPLMSGKPAEIKAEPFGENTFDGWYVNGSLASTDAVLTFTYDPANPPKYEARFTKSAFGIDGSFETGYTNGQLLAEAVHAKDPKNADTDWTPTSFLGSVKDNSGFYVDSHYGGTWRKATITNAMAHTGNNSVCFSGQYGLLGYKYSGLTPNTEYILSVYAYLTADKTTDWAGTSTILVTPANESCIVKRADNSYGANNTTALAYKYIKNDLDVTAGWTKLELKVNTGSNTDVIFWIDSNGTNAKLYLDNFAIKRPPQTFKPKVSDTDLGSATSETTDVLEGADVTVTAESINDGQFKGWYIGEELMSSDLTYTFKYQVKFADLTAKFEAGPNTLPDYSFENRFTNGQVLAQSPNVSYSKNDTAGLWTEDLFKTSSKDGENKFFIDSEWSMWGNVTATTEESHTGNFSIKMSPNSRYMGYKIEGLSKNTKYIVSFYAMTKGTKDSKTDTVAPISITDGNMSCMTKSGSNIVVRTVEAGALAKYTAPDSDARNTWKKFSVNFDSKDSTSVIVWLRPEGDGTNLYLDDLTIRFAPKQFKPTSNNSGLGSVTPNDYVECAIGDSITVKATPYPNVTFVGWYVGDELISTDAEFTFNYEDKYQGLEAVFAGMPGTIPNGSFEYYQNGQVLAKYSNSTFENNPPWYVNTTYRTDNNLALTVTNERAHTGEKAATLNIPYRIAGLDIEGLQPETQYLVSFWAYITGKDPTDPSQDQNPKNVTSAFILKKGQEPVVLNESTGKYQSIGTSSYLGNIDAQVDCYNKWEKVSVLFTTPADVKDVTLWINFSGYQAKLYIDDFEIGYGVKVGCSADLGGSVSSTQTSDYVLKGSEVTFTATPFEGNTFTGWYNVNGDLVSSDATYTFTANEAVNLIAKFDGYNKPAVDLFALDGKDGTFENGTVPGWIFADPEYPCTWCSAGVSSKLVYEGSKSLEINGRYRNSILPLNGLTPNSDYRLSFYVNQPDTDSKANISSIGIIGSESDHLGTANVIFDQVGQIKANSGWHRVDLYFNSGADTSARLIIRFAAETLAGGFYDRLYVDNLSLVNYNLPSSVTNGAFNDGKSSWLGKGTVVAEGTNNALSLNAGETAYHGLKVDAFSTYTVKFRAKGKLVAAAQDLIKYSGANIKDYISSVSFTEADSTDWKEYSYTVYSGINEAINFIFSADTAAMIDDFKVIKNAENSGSILEQIDFESDRFALSSDYATSQFSIYNATDSNDPLVVSGKKSLKFTYDPALGDTVTRFDPAWLAYQPGVGNNFKISLNYKIVGGKAGGTVGLAPEYSGTYGTDVGFEHLSLNTEWKKLIFYVSNIDFGALKVKIASVLGSTASDFYIDDIVITVAPPMVNEENSKLTYCERLYNAVDNEGFEDPASEKDWKDLPKTAKIIKGEALKGSHFLRASAGTKYVLPVQVKANAEYYFAASVRGTSKTVGSIGVTIDPNGVEYYSNRDEEPASRVSFDPKETGWKRSGFKFTTGTSGVVYLCIDVKAGALDIDSVMLFTSEYGYRYDPNDYTNYVPYDYDNLKSYSTVINGGFGEQPYFKGVDSDSDGIIDNDFDNDGVADDLVTDDASDSPSTGDSVATPAMVIILAVLASVALLFIRKRKEGAENA